MKRFIFCVFAFCLFCSCSGKDGQNFGRPVAVLRSLSSAETFSQALECYSSGTRKMVTDIVSMDGINEADIMPVLSFLKGAREWDVMNEELTGDNARLELVISDHVSDNRIGSRMICSLKREKGLWKIDMEKDLAEMKGTLQRNRRKENDYLDKKLRRYQ